MTQRTFVFESELPAQPDVVWDRVVSLDGISDELSPLMRMTAPKGIERLSDVDFSPGVPLFRSWFLLFRAIPIDRSEVTLLELTPGKGFVEESPMFSMRLWRHERTLEPQNGNTLLTDRLTFTPRFAAPLATWIVRTLFTHRHRRLRAHFGH